MKKSNENLLQTKNPQGKKSKIEGEKIFVRV